MTHDPDRAVAMHKSNSGKVISASSTTDVNAQPWPPGLRLGCFGKSPLNGIA